MERVHHPAVREMYRQRLLRHLPREQHRRMAAARRAREKQLAEARGAVKRLEGALATSVQALILGRPLGRDDVEGARHSTREIARTMPGTPAGQHAAAIAPLLDGLGRYDVPADTTSRDSDRKTSGFSRDDAGRGRLGHLDPE